MDKRLTRRLLDQRPKKRNTDRIVTSAIGVIDASDTTLVKIGNSNVSFVHAANYTPTASDRVYILLSGDDPPFVVDEIA